MDESGTEKKLVARINIDVFDDFSTSERLQVNCAMPYLRVAIGSLETIKHKITAMLQETFTDFMEKKQK